MPWRILIRYCLCRPQYCPSDVEHLPALRNNPACSAHRPFICNRSLRASRLQNRPTSAIFCAICGPLKRINYVPLFLSYPRVPEHCHFSLHIPALPSSPSPPVLSGTSAVLVVRTLPHRYVISTSYVRSYVIHTPRWSNAAHSAMKN